MTQEEKVKAYDEAIKRAKKELNTCGSQDCDAARQIFRFFPELKKSEDEKIRKLILELVKQSSHILNPMNQKSMIAWLEKQGEKKPADKAGTKFKIEKGKWYVCIKDLLDNYANKTFCEGDAYLSTQDGSLIPSNSNVPYKVVCHDTYFRDWTIQDAKNGDVLAESKMGVILMFRGIGNTNWDDVIDYHCYYNCYMKDFIVQEDVEHWGNIENNKLVPVTKEQRDLLFQKMKEAGYMWDAEKKELKKIEHDVQLTKFEKEIEYLLNIYRDVVGDNNVTTEEVKRYTTYLLSLIHQMSAWSEEDELMLEGAIDKISDLGTGEMIKDWLKSLKERVQPQPKQEWSEEDEKKRDAIIGILDFQANKAPDRCCATDGFLLDELIDWLKLLKPQKHWKPGEYDISLLEEIARNIRNNVRPFCSEVSTLEDSIKNIKTL